MKISSWLPLLSWALVACSPSQAPAPAGRQAPAASTARPAAATTTTLARHHWQLQDAVDGNNQRLGALFDHAAKPLQLDFTVDRVMVSNACNNLSGNYKIVDGHLLTGPLRQTLMACADATLRQRESTIKKVLQARPTLISAASGGKPLLTLSAADGTTLTFAGQPNAETRFAGPGVIEFMDVASEPTACQQPAASCLKVRLLHYDEHGLRTGEAGAWGALAQPIEGYEHQPGVRNVLRVKRYTLPNTPADAASVVYVLDMVVESETVVAEPKN